MDLKLLRSLLRRLDRVRAEEARIQERLTAERKRLAERGCEHPKEFVEDFTWEWDDGYGLQKTMTGKRCTICGCLKQWEGSQHWFRPSEVTD